MAKNNLDTVTEFLAQQRTAASSESAILPVGEDEAAPETAQQGGEPVEEEDQIDGQETAEEEELPEGEEPDEGQDVDFATYNDDDVIEVRVDGETKEVTIRDLKIAYGGEGAIDKRLHEATETRKAATAEREKVVKEAETARGALMSVIQQLDDALHSPTVPRPDESLRATNPRAYLDQMDRFQQESAALEQSRQQLVTAFQQHSQQVEALRAEQKQAQLRLLQDNFEPIRNEKTRGQASKDILEAASAYGFTNEDLQGVIDHRVYMMAYDAAQYRKLKASSTTQLGEETVEKAKGKTRVLRSSSAAARQQRMTRSQKEAKAVKDRAAQSGKVDDVAAFLASNRRNRSK